MSPYTAISLGCGAKGPVIEAIEAAYQVRANEDLPFPDFETVYQQLKTVYEEEDKSDDTLTEVLKEVDRIPSFSQPAESGSLMDNLTEETLVVDLHALPALRELVAFCVIEKLYRELKAMPDAPVDNRTNSRQLRTLLVIDEAHNYLATEQYFSGEAD